MKLLSAKEVQKMCGISRTTIWRLENKKMFPARIQISDRRVGWDEDEIRKHLGSRRIEGVQNEQ